MVLLGLVAESERRASGEHEERQTMELAGEMIEDSWSLVLHWIRIERMEERNKEC